MTAGPTLSDGAGNTSAINSSAQVVTNGTVESNTANVNAIALVGGTFYQRNTAGNWYQRTGPNTYAANPVADPRPAQSADKTLVTTVGPQVTDSTRATSSITSGGQVLTDGFVESNTANVTKIYVGAGGQFYQYGGGAWYQRTGPNTYAANPVSDPTVATSTTTSTSTYFQAKNGKLYDPAGNLFQAKGVNITPYTGYAPSYFAAVKALFPKINYVRLVTADGWSQGGQDSGVVYQFISDATSAKVAVMIDNHRTGQALSGTALSNATAWYSALATKYLNNPYVLFNTCNEPAGDAATIAAEQLAVYNAIRNTGNNTVLFLALRGGAETAWMSGLESTWSGMHNVGREVHFYDPFNGATHNQATVTGSVTSTISAAQTVKSADGVMPIHMGEFGPSITGAANTTDPNAAEVLTAVFGLSCGYTAWAWNGTTTPGGDSLSDDGATLTTWGQTLAGDMSNAVLAQTSLSGNGSAVGGSYDQYFLASGNRETHGVFSLTLTPIFTTESGNSYPALGAYQFDKNALIAVGYYTDDGNLNGLPWVDANFTGLDGITSKVAFLAAPAEQTKAAKAWHAKVAWPGLAAQGCLAYIGQTVTGIVITASGLLGGTSLLGPTAVSNFLTSGGVTDGTDGYGTKISSYILGLGGFTTPFYPVNSALPPPVGTTTNTVPAASGSDIQVHLAKPQGWNVPASLYGISCGHMSVTSDQKYSGLNVAAIRTAIGNLKFGMVRLNWDRQTTMSYAFDSGTFDSSSVDAFINNAGLFNIGSVPLVITIGWSSAVGSALAAGNASSVATTHQSQCNQMAAYFKSKGLTGICWELVNEPDPYDGNDGSTSDMSALATMFNAMCAGIKTADSTAKCGGVTSSYRRDDHIVSWYNLCSPKPDFITWHSYLSSGTSEADVVTINKVFGGNTNFASLRSSLGGFTGVLGNTERNWNGTPSDNEPRNQNVIGAVLMAADQMKQIQGDHNAVFSCIWDIGPGDSTYGLIDYNDYHIYPTGLLLTRLAGTMPGEALGMSIGPSLTGAAVSGGASTGAGHLIGQSTILNGKAAVQLVNVGDGALTANLVLNGFAGSSVTKAEHSPANPNGLVSTLAITGGTGVAVTVPAKSCVVLSG